MNCIDILVPLRKEMPVWPDSKTIDFKKVSAFEKGDSVNVATVTTDVHVGTHIENSLHFIVV